MIIRPSDPAGAKFTSEAYSFSYRSQGFMTDGSTVCRIDADGKAGREITGRSKAGLLDLQLSEYADDSGLTGKLNCPGDAAIEGGTAYPHSRAVARFHISSDSTTVTDFTERDVSGQFSHRKTRTLIVPPEVVSGP